MIRVSFFGKQRRYDVATLGFAGLYGGLSCVGARLSVALAGKPALALMVAGLALGCAVTAGFVAGRAAR